jgi:hypothetical protein
MKWLERNRMRLMLIGVMAIIVLGGGSAKADFTFGEPVNLGSPVNSENGEEGPTISPDGLELYFVSDRPAPGLHAWANLWVAKRPTQHDNWDEPVLLGPEINSAYRDDWPHLSPDGLELYFMSDRPGGYGPSPTDIVDIWVSRRSALSEPWGTAVNLGLPVNSADYYECSASITADGLEIFLSRETHYGLPDLWSASRATCDDPWNEPASLGPIVNSSASDTVSCVSSDGLLLCFSSPGLGSALRSGGCGGPDIWVTTRPTRNDPWKQPWNPGPPLNTASTECCPNISPDGRWLYFSDFWWESEQEVRPGGHGSDDLWKAPIIPIVDFNGDGIVDAADMSIMVDHWGEDYSLCDIGPMPWGDGIVDVLDLVVLTEYIEPIDRTLIAHWELDEIEGDIAQDSTVGNNDADVFGNPTWQPDGGKEGGALQFDGVDDYINTPFVFNPKDGSFSVFAWIKGGAPGQVIISQADVEGQSAIESGGTWLGISPSDGKLMTGLMSIFFGTLESESVVTDEQWHHVGLVYDYTTMKRHLYVDGTEVAVDDSVVAGVKSTAGLYIGAGQTLEAGTFFSGLIDDVRIYNQALTAEEIAVLAQ